MQTNNRYKLAFNSNQKRKILFVLSNLLGNKFYSSRIRQAIENLEDIEPTYLYIEVEDYQRFPAPKLLRISDAFTAAWITRKKFQKIVKNDSFDALFFNTFEPMIGFWKMLRRIPTAVVMDVTKQANYEILSLGDINFTNKFILLVKTKLMNGIYKRLFRHIRRFLPISKWCAQSLINDHGIDSKIVDIIPCPIDTTLWKPGKKKFNNQKPIVLFVGNDFRRKGGEFLLKLHHKYLSLDCVLRIVSNDVYLKHKLLPDGIELIQGLNGQCLNELIGVYQGSDLFVFPTIRDAFPIVLAEAASIGLPIVTSSHIPGIREIVQDGVNGYLLPYGDERLWVKTIQEFIRNPELLKKLGENGRKVALKRFSLRDFNSKIEKTVRDILTGY